MRRVHTAAPLVVALVLSACAAIQGATSTPTPGATSVPGATPAQAASAVPQAEPAPYRPPSKPCDAVPAATRKKHDLTEPDESVYPNPFQDPTTGEWVTIDILICSLWVENPARGPDGRPSHLFLFVYLQVPTAEHTNDPVRLAQALFDDGQENLGSETLVGTTPTVKRVREMDDLGERAYSAVLSNETTTGEATDVVVAFQAANAYVKVSYSGEDQKLNSSDGMHSTPVPARRLRPVAESVARDVLEALG